MIISSSELKLSAVKFRIMQKKNVCVLGLVRVDGGGIFFEI